MKISIVTIAICLCASIKTATTTFPITKGSIGEQVKVVKDTVVPTTEGDEMKQECPFRRRLVVRYSVQGADFDTIDYRFVQCLGEDKETVKSEVIAYQLPNSEEWHELPEGCLPPTHQVEVPQVSECEMGYNIGQVISKTIANLVVPQFLADDEANPIEQDETFIKYKQLMEEKDKQIDETTSLEDFKAKQETIVDELKNLIENFAEEKIKCFEEKLLPIEQTDIEIICANQGAHKSVEDALKAALNDQIDCSHVNCAQMEADIHDGKHAFASLLNVDQQGFFNTEHDYVEGQEDVNGNVRIPSPEEQYLIVHSDNKFNRYIEVNGESVKGTRYCDLDSKNLKYILKRVRDTYYTIQDAQGAYLKVGANNTIVATTEYDDFKQDRYLFRIVQNLGGTVTFSSALNPNKVIGQLGSSVHLETFNKDNLNERYYLRTSCLGSEEMVQAENEKAKLYKDNKNNKGVRAQ